MKNITTNIYFAYLFDKPLDIFDFLFNKKNCPNICKLVHIEVYEVLPKSSLNLNKLIDYLIFLWYLTQYDRTMQTNHC